nr:ribosomal-processing cysteine protease Prp [Sedimentibacter sp.]
MISVTIHKTNDLFDGFVVSGHSNYGDSGTDIVCSAVSILSYTALNSMSLVAGISESDISYDVEDDTGFLKVETLKNNEKTDVIYKNFLVGIKLLLEDYNNYITLNYEEV